MWLSIVSRINFIIIHISREQKELFKNIPNYIHIVKKITAHVIPLAITQANILVFFLKVDSHVFFPKIPY